MGWVGDAGATLFRFSSLQPQDAAFSAPTRNWRTGGMADGAESETSTDPESERFGLKFSREGREGREGRNRLIYHLVVCGLYSCLWDE